MIRNGPKVSVIIPAYNSAEFLQETINSMLNQSYQDFEIIIVDDGSIDNTRKIVQINTQKYLNKIKYFYQKNKGPSAARNKGIKESRGKYIAFLDADDMWLEGYLDKCLRCFVENEYDVVMTDNYIDTYDKDNKFIDRQYKSREKYLGNENKLYEILFQRFQKGFFGEIRIILKKSCFDKIGFFDEKLRILEDWELWLRIAKENLKIGYIQEPLFIYRRHPNAVCRNKKNERLKLVNAYVAFRKHREEAFKMNKSLNKVYSQTLWMLGSESVMSRIDILFGLKSMFESQMYNFDKKKIIRLIKKYLNLSK